MNLHNQSRRLSTGAESRLVLSLFPGAGLLDEGFTAAGFCVVRAPDTLLGGDVRRFHAAASHFEGVIGGPPCQDYSRARRRPPTGYGDKMLAEFARLVTESGCSWWLLENVPTVPSLVVHGYTVQRFNLYASEFGLRHRRNRSFQFGHTDHALTILRGTQSHRLKPTPLASDGARGRRRNFADHCADMGLPRTFDLPGLSRRAKFRAVGNGVPVPMAFAVACAVRDRRVTFPDRSHCPCGCGRLLDGKQLAATAACRKRLERLRHGAGPLTLDPLRAADMRPAPSHPKPSEPDEGGNRLRR